MPHANVLHDTQSLAVFSRLLVASDNNNNVLIEIHNKLKRMNQRNSHSTLHIDIHIIAIITHTSVVDAAVNHGYSVDIDMQLRIEEKQKEEIAETRDMQSLLFST